MIVTPISEWTHKWALKKHINVWFQPTASSTNDIAKSEPSYDLFLTNHQTQGRGQGQNTWTDNADGKNLICSWLFKLEKPPQHFSGALWGLCTYQALSKCWPQISWNLKAPNDIYINSKKVGGILLESSSQGSIHQLVFGLGLNVSQSPQTLSGTTTNIKENFTDEARITELKWNEFLDTLHSYIQKTIFDCQKNKISQAQKEKLKNALNLNPLLSKKVETVTENGSFVLDGSEVHWSELNLLYTKKIKDN